MKILANRGTSRVLNVVGLLVDESDALQHQYLRYRTLSGEHCEEILIMETVKSKRTIGIGSALFILLLGFFCAPVFARDPDPLQSMQTLIENQQRQIETQQGQLESQQGQLKAQQKQLEQQSQLLVQFESQLKTLVAQNKSDAATEGVDQAEKIAAPTDLEQTGSATVVAAVDPAKEPRGAAIGTVSPALADQINQDSKDHETHDATFGGNETASYWTQDYKWSDLDGAPTDVDDKAGIFLESDDGRRMLRLYGSIRARGYFEDQENPDAWVLNLGQIVPVKPSNNTSSFNATSKESRFGVDMGLRDVVVGRAEFDFRGGGSEDLRIRHLYMRSEHWVAGKTWTAVNTLLALATTLDYHSTGAAVGPRITQLKYMNGFGPWQYQISLEDPDLKIDAPDSLSASEKNQFPNLAGNIAHKANWGEIRLGGLLAANRVSYTGGTDSDLGWAATLATRLNINDNNVFKGHIITTKGQSSLFADFTKQKLDVVYDPATNSFKTLKSTGGQIALEHQWTDSGLSTTIGGGFIDQKLANFQKEQEYGDGYKALVNLLFKPKGKYDGITLGVEFAAGWRSNADGTDNNTQRAVTAIWYDF